MSDTTVVARSRGLGGRWIRPVLWSTAAQALSSATNFGLTILLTTTADVEDLGRILAVISVYLLALTLSRSLITEPLVAASGDRPSSAIWPKTRHRLLRLAMVAMPITTAVGAGLGMATGPYRIGLVLVVVTLPALMLQDGRRYLAWATGHPRVPALLDACWLIVSVTAVGLTAMTSAGLGPVSVIAAWSAGGVVSWLVGRRVPEPPALDPRLAGRRQTGADGGDGGDGDGHEPLRYRVLARSQAIMTAAVNLGPVVLALAVSPTATAAMKLTLIPFTVMLSLFAGLRVLTLPALRRAIDHDGGSRALGLLVGSTAAVATAFALISIRIVRLVGGDSLPGGQSSGGEVTTGGASLADAFGLVDRHLAVGAVIGVLYVVGQQLADAVALAGRPGVVVRRLMTVGAEWSGLLVGAAIGGVDGMIAGWAGGLTVATTIWAAAWLHRPPPP